MTGIPLNKLDLHVFTIESGEKVPGLDWELSEETKQAIRAIDENIARAKALAPTILLD